MARGIDVHPYYQADLNWSQVQNVGFVWVKASDGGAAYSKNIGGVTYRPDTHVNGAKSRGIPVGVYHYAQFGPAPEAQADILLREAERLGANGVAPMLDLEYPFTANAAAKNFAVAFLKRVAARGYRPCVYMNNAFAKALRPDQWGIPDLVIVIARYGAKPEAAAGRYDVHQYDDKGSLAGSLVDLDESYTDNHLTGEDMPLNDADKAWISGQLTNNAGWWYGPRFRGNLNYAQCIQAMQDTLDAVKALVLQGSGVTAQQIADALKPALAATVLPVVTQAVTEALGADNQAEADAVSAKVVHLLGEKLAS